MNSEPQSPTGATSADKLEALRRYVRQLGSALICYSGGIDSALVLAVAHEQEASHRSIQARRPWLADGGVT